jgi:methylthioribose-1-phosphate isomerase
MRSGLVEASTAAGEVRKIGPVKTIEWREGALHLIDQRRLPNELLVERCDDVGQVARAISELRVRGAPAIGIAAAYGLVIAAGASAAQDVEALRHDVIAAADVLRATRPTAVNLGWALDRMLEATHGDSIEEMRARLEATANALAIADAEACRRMGDYGAELIPEGAGVLTHCNAGALATAEFGTALGVIRAAYAQGRVREVLADETRPVLQGARLTAWELQQDGIPVTLIADGAAAHFMGRGRVQAVVVGADRIAANGDTANKIGTYAVAVLAREHDIPFYVAAPLSTIDLNTPDGQHIPIEERSSREVTHVGSSQLAPAGARVWNPAFDVTPHQYIAGIITERGIFRPPYAESLRAAFAAEAAGARG